jgi:hypothetical protein
MCFSSSLLLARSLADLSEGKPGPWPAQPRNEMKSYTNIAMRKPTISTQFTREAVHLLAIQFVTSLISAAVRRNRELISELRSCSSSRTESIRWAAAVQQRVRTESGERAEVRDRRRPKLRPTVGRHTSSICSIFPARYRSWSSTICDPCMRIYAL